jgi:hypothetical protein
MNRRRRRDLEKGETLRRGRRKRSLMEGAGGNARGLAEAEGGGHEVGESAG